MPAKSTSPEAAQNKQRKAEIREMEKRRSKIRRDFREEQKRLIAACNSANKALDRFMVRVEKQLPKEEAGIDRRIAILKGRIGL
jgi:hypothetical protein